MIKTDNLFLVKLMDSCFFNNQACLVLERADWSLINIIYRNPVKDEELPFQLIQRCCKDVLSGLSYLHEMEIVHGDLKPANVLWCGQRDCFVIVDFTHSAFLSKLVGCGDNV